MIEPGPRSSRHTAKKRFASRHPLVFVFLLAEAFNFVLALAFAITGTSFLDILAGAIHAHGAAKWIALIGLGVVQLLLLMFVFSGIEAVLCGIGFAVYSISRISKPRGVRGKNSVDDSVSDRSTGASG